MWSAGARRILITSAKASVFHMFSIDAVAAALALNFEQTLTSQKG
jgi:hypothetical protein